MSAEAPMLYAKLAALEAQLAALQARMTDKTELDSVQGSRFLPTVDEFGGGGFVVLGTKAKYKVIALREWDNGAITAVGSEGSDLTKLQPTYDYVRMHP